MTQIKADREKKLKRNRADHSPLATVSSRTPISLEIRSFLLALFAVFLFAISANAADPQEICARSELDFRPYCFTDKNGQSTGFGVELLRAVAEKATLRLRISPGEWDKIWNELVAGEIDVLPVVARTPGREGLVEFTLPHTETFDAFFVREGQPPIKDLDAAAGKEIVVLRSDAAHHQLVERNFRGKIVPVDSIPEGLRLIASGRHNALLCSRLIGILERDQAGIKGVTDGPMIPDYNRVFSFAVRKGNTELVERLNQGLRIVEADGTYDRLYRKWLGGEMPPLPFWQTYFWQAIGVFGVLVLIAITWAVARRALESDYPQSRTLTPDRVPPVFWKYALAVVTVAASYALRVGLEAWVGRGLPPYITFYPAVMITALLGGIGPGLLSTCLTAMIVCRWEMAPIGQLIASPANLLGVVLFCILGLFMTAVAELHRRNRAKAAAFDREEALREARREKEFLADLLEAAEQPFATGYPDGRIGLINRSYEELTGYTAAELRALDWSTVLTPPEWRDLERQKLDELRRTGHPVRYEKEYIRKNGTRAPIELLVSISRDADGEPEFYYSFITDISARKEAESALRESERMYRAIGESIDYGVWVCDPDGRNIYASDSFLKLVGITQQQCSDFGWGDVLHPDDAERTIAAWKECVRTGRTWDIEHRFRGVDGEWHPILARGMPVRDEQGQIVRWAGINLDIGRLKQTEEALKASLGEKEVLLKEIHHRVKNNMQVISSLVDLQADQLQDEAMRAVLKDVTLRVRSMALVHEKLYQSEDMARVEFAEYAESLLGYLWRAHGTVASSIRLALELDPVPLSVNTAVPCGLILNELATNALKHAFRGEKGGEVIVSLHRGPEGGVCLRVRDNGTGLPEGLDWRKAKSLGLSLVQILAKQLSAIVEVNSGEGTEFSISFGGPNL